MSDESSSHNHRPRTSKWLFPIVGELWSSTTRRPGEELDAIDARPTAQWRSRYPEAIHDVIAQELLYLVVLFVVAMLMVGAAASTLRGSSLLPLPLSPRTMKMLAEGQLAASAGLFGGTIFSLKWLYHSVAKGSWHLDRRIWRLSTPFISSGLALAVIALIRSEMLRVLNPGVTYSLSGIFGLSFLVGYFSDITVGKLNELAEVLFAPSRQKNPSSRFAGNGAQPTESTTTSSAPAGGSTTEAPAQPVSEDRS